MKKYKTFLHLISLSVALSFGATTTVSSLPKNLAALSCFAETAKAKDSLLLKNESKSSVKYFNQFKMIVLCYLALTSCSLLPKVGPQHPQTGYTDIAQAAEEGKIAPLLEIIEADPIEQRRLSALAQLQFFLRLEKSDRTFNLPSITILRKLFSVLDKEKKPSIRKEILNAIGMALFLTKENLQAQPMREEKVAAFYQLYFEENEDEKKTILAALEEAGSPFNFANLVQFFIYLATQPADRQNLELQTKVVLELKQRIKNNEGDPRALERISQFRIFKGGEENETPVAPRSAKNLAEMTLPQLRQLAATEKDLETLVEIVEKMGALPPHTEEDLKTVRDVIEQILNDPKLTEEAKADLASRALSVLLQMIPQTGRLDVDRSFGLFPCSVEVAL